MYADAPPKNVKIKNVIKVGIQRNSYVTKATLVRIIIFAIEPALKNGSFMKNVSTLKMPKMMELRGAQNER